ncbi:hypothetical protein N7451_010395 [Penicillium sp. IBT 35674x]|nr:hypothetical protein N7451_010395 [Penicillium sp. IBT 35674x]
MATRGLSYKGLDAFYEAASNGTLPMTYFVVDPTELLEHPPYKPIEAAWLYNYDVGGFGDHVTAFYSHNGTAGEWIENPYDLFGNIYTGSGFRVPFYTVSPWTRGGRISTERSDHNSQILSLEAWLEALGYGDVMADDMEPWRREHMPNLGNVFDFSNPNFTIPVIPSVDDPATDLSGSFAGTATCESTYQVQRPVIPYGNRTEASALYFEDGFKEIVCYLTKGRYLTFEKDGYSFTNYILSYNGDQEC